MKRNSAKGLTPGFGLIFVVAFASSCLGQELPRDVKWVTGSIEYAAVCEQTYRAAWQAVKEASQSVEGNWAVVLDVDETALDNSQYAVERAALDSVYSPYSWNAWVQRKEATLVPGAKKFIDQVRALGDKAHIVYITNRRYHNESVTVENLRKYDLFRDGDIILTRKNESSKVKRRECVEQGTGDCAGMGPLVILAFLGDNIRDIIPMRGKAYAEEYRKNIENDPNWGRKFFMLPNPTYGSWQRDYE